MPSAVTAACQAPRQHCCLLRGDTAVTCAHALSGKLHRSHAFASSVGQAFALVVLAVYCSGPCPHTLQLQPTQLLQLHTPLPSTLSMPLLAGSSQHRCHIVTLFEPSMYRAHWCVGGLATAC